MAMLTLRRLVLQMSAHRSYLWATSVKHSMAYGQVVRWLIVVVLAIAAPVRAQHISSEKRAALDAVEAMAHEIHVMSMTLWDYSETALREFRSAELLIGILENSGIPVARGVTGIPTAFVARYGQGSPSIGILAEYDALPGVGNAPVPEAESVTMPCRQGRGVAIIYLGQFPSGRQLP